jgi:hypothetical protein
MNKAHIETPDRLERPDDFYAALLAAHEGLSEADSHALNARLLLLLANEVGSQERLLALLAAAGQGSRTGDPHDN